MKRYRILLTTAVLAMTITACVKDSFTDNYVQLNAGDFAFSIGSVTTKVSVPTEVEPVHKIQLGNTGLYLDESVTNLNEGVISTKGSPIYTENINKYYTSINAIGYCDGDVVAPDTAFGLLKPGIANKVVYHRPYYNYFWPEDPTKELYFFLRAPADYIDTRTSNQGVSTLNYNTDNGSISFDYTSVYTGEAQKDMLFTSRKLSKNQYYDSKTKYYEEGAPVVFYHALTGVKFRVGSDNDGATKTIITNVTLTNLYDTGHCVITPSSDGDKVVWSNRRMSLGTFSQGFDNTAYSDMGVKGDDEGEGEDKPLDNSVNLNNSNFANTSLVTGAADKNLNDEDGSLTFWLIPQQLTEDVELTITFRVKTPDTPNGTEITHTVKFGDMVRKKTINDDNTITYGDYPTWNAGELRTYTLNPKDVDVEIFDTMSGLSKTNLHVTNTGNVPEYIRMLVIGNWYGWETEADQTAGKEPEILVGYKYKGDESADQIKPGDTIDTMADPWYREDPQYGQYFDGTFTNGKPTGTNKWIRGTTGFYYPDPIGPGQTLNSQTEALFKSYIWPENVPIPTIYIPDPNSKFRKPAVGVHLIMEVAVQAIGSKKSDGTDFADCWEAWNAAIYPNGVPTDAEKIGPKP